MAQTTLNVRVDTDDKRRVESFCKNTGINLTSLINLYIKKVAREQRIPFEIEADPFYSEENMQRLRHSIMQLKEGKYAEHELIEVD